MSSKAKNQPAEPVEEADQLTVEDLQAQLEAQGDLIAEYAAKIETLEAELGALKATKPVPAAVGVPTETFECDGVEFRVVHGVTARIDGDLRRVTPTEILRRPELREQLARSGSSAVARV